MTWGIPLEQFILWIISSLLLSRDAFTIIQRLLRVAKKLPQSASSTLVNCLCSYFSVNMTTFLWMLQLHFTRARSTLSQTYFPCFNDDIFISYTTLCRTLDYLTVTWSCSLSGRHLLNSWKLYIYIFIYKKKILKLS